MEVCPCLCPSDTGSSGVENSQIAVVSVLLVQSWRVLSCSSMSLSNESGPESPSGNTAHTDEMKPLGTFSPFSRSQAGSRYDWSSAVL